MNQMEKWKMACKQSLGIRMIRMIRFQSFSYLWLAGNEGMENNMEEFGVSMGPMPFV